MVNCRRRILAATIVALVLAACLSGAFMRDVHADPGGGPKGPAEGPP